MIITENTDFLETFILAVKRYYRVWQQVKTNRGQMIPAGISPAIKNNLSNIRSTNAHAVRINSDTAHSIGGLQIGKVAHVTDVASV